MFCFPDIYFLYYAVRYPISNKQTTHHCVTEIETQLDALYLHLTTEVCSGLKPSMNL